jgi:hypothetical protein
MLDSGWAANTHVSWYCSWLTDQTVTPEPEQAVTDWSSSQLSCCRKVWLPSAPNVCRCSPPAPNTPKNLQQHDNGNTGQAHNAHSGDRSALTKHSDENYTGSFVRHCSTLQTCSTLQARDALLVLLVALLISYCAPSTDSCYKSCLAAGDLLHRVTLSLVELSCAELFSSIHLPPLDKAVPTPGHHISAFAAECGCCDTCGTA